VGQRDRGLRTKRPSSLVETEEATGGGQTGGSGPRQRLRARRRPGRGAKRRGGRRGPIPHLSLVYGGTRREIDGDSQFVAGRH
jgi:hypothetical protein